MSEMATILARCNFQCAMKNVAHRIDVSKAALAGNRFHAVVTFFESPASGFDAQAFYELRGRGLHFFGEDPGEIARTHRDSMRQHRHRERFVQIVEHPRLEFAQWFAVGQLQRERGTELRLSAWPPEIEHQVARDLQCQMRTVVFFDQRQCQVHSRCDSGRRVNILVTDKYWVRINVGARGAFDENMTPVPMRCGPSAVEQTCSRKQHRAGANRADSPDSSGDFSQPAHHVTVYFILLDRAATGYEQGVDLSTHFPKSFMRGDSQSTVRHKRSLRRRADDFYRIDWVQTGILFAEHFRSARKDLKRPDQIDDLRARRGHEHDPPRSR